MNAPFGGQQQQLYPHQPIPPRPPKKRKTGLIVGLSIGIVFFLALIGGGVAFTLAYMDAHADGGEPYTGDTLPPLCDVVDAVTLRMARTTNPLGDLSSAEPSGSPSLTVCVWGQTEGSDGERERGLKLEIYAPGPEYIATARPNCPLGSEQPAPQLGEKACAAFDYAPGMGTYYVSAIQGNHQVSVRYNGSDIEGFSDIVSTPEPQLRSTATAVLEDALRNLAGR